MKPLYFVPFAVVALLLGAIFLPKLMANKADPEAAEALPSTFIGKPAPELALDGFAGQPELTAELLAGDGLKLVNFWASWCAPCRVEHPNLVAIAEAGVPIYGINYKDDPAKAAAFLAELGNPYAAIGADTEGRNGFGWGVYGVPETYLIDGEGRIVLRVAGPVTSSSYARDLGPALEAAGIEVTLGE
ncbi:DsbE family thiol:disulfide interchange protein [Vannielia litorea]|uniref:DsbE family thiol:disulfide interchange protein n=1 Tax=Vannielia litorea TaxID=1217970 RepID=UPI001C978E8C|nr:DsbE family thiol:disulfide interchange protein [Vannielia litorea]MBY6047107.1 DsbE family thiol:disulfide interchange protein [Vannielia litorea]MBY6074521.1 DsbE family thiol:disulfide interchange protein [Vannielia litorea]